MGPETANWTYGPWTLRHKGEEKQPKTPTEKKRCWLAKKQVSAGSNLCFDGFCE